MTDSVRHIGTRGDELGTFQGELGTLGGTKRLPLMWPIRLYKAVKKEADRQDTSMLTIVTEALLDKAGLEHWRVKSRSQAKIMEIVDWAERNTPQDLLDAVEEAKRNLERIRSKVALTQEEDIILEGQD